MKHEDSSPPKFSGKLSLRMDPDTALLGEPYTVLVTVENNGTAQCNYILNWEVRDRQTNSTHVKRISLAPGECDTSILSDAWRSVGENTFTFELMLEHPPFKGLLLLEKIKMDVFVQRERSFGSIAIPSTPPGATVLIDGVVRGETPCKVTDLSVGQHSVVLKKNGFQNTEFYVIVRPGSCDEISVSLNHASFSIDPQLLLKVTACIAVAVVPHIATAIAPGSGILVQSILSPLKEFIH